MAKALKTRLTQNPYWTGQFIRLGQFKHQATSRSTIMAAGHRSLRVKPLDEAAALNNGADFFAETLIFGVAAGSVLFELNRSNDMKALDTKKKKNAEAAKDRALTERINAIEESIQRLDAAQREMLEAQRQRERGLEMEAGRRRRSWGLLG